MASATITPGVYFIQNVRRGNVLDMDGAKRENGTRVQGFAKRELDDPSVGAQLWIITPTKDNSSAYLIQNAASRTYLNLTRGLEEKGTPIIGHQDDKSANLRWLITRSVDKTAYVIENVASKTFVDLYRGGIENHTPINGWAGPGPSTTNTNQLWHIVRA